MSDQSDFFFAAKRKQISALGFLTAGDEAFAGELSIFDAKSDKPERGARENALILSRFPYAERVWDLTDPDALANLLSEFFGTPEEFLTAYRARCRQAIETTDCRFAFGLEAVGTLLRDHCSSAVYLKTMLDLTDCIAKRDLVIGYSLHRKEETLSPAVLRRLAELRGRILPASFAFDPSELRLDVEATLSSARAAGVGSYVTYQNEGWESRPIATYKENL